MDALSELGTTLDKICERCPECRSDDYVGGRCRDCGFRRRPVKVDARAILKAKGLR